MEFDEMEKNISGFCRTCNGMQTVLCEYVITEEGKKLDSMNCAHETCIHHGACTIYQDAHEEETNR